MNKAELVSAIAERTGLSKKDSEKALGAAVDTIIDALREGDKVQLMGFGSFEVKYRPEHVGRNPSSGEAMTVPASKTPQFKAGKAFKDAIAE